MLPHCHNSSALVGERIERKRDGIGGRGHKAFTILGSDVRGGSRIFQRGGGGGANGA